MQKLTMLRLAAMLSFAATAHAPAGADPASDVAAVRAQFTQSQWDTIKRLRFMPLLLPSYLPPGFVVSDAKPDGEQPPTMPFFDGVAVTYARGKDTISWVVDNGRQGGDVDPKQFQYVYHSAVLGDGTVRLDDRKCWSTNNLTGPDNGRFRKRGTDSFTPLYFFLWSCGSAVSPGELVRMAESVVVVQQGTLLGFDGSKMATEARVLAPTGRDVRIFASEAAPCGSPEPQHAANGGRPASASIPSGTKVFLLSDPATCRDWSRIGVLLKGRIDAWWVRTEEVRRT